MRWVKLVTSLRRNPIFRHASPGAKLLFYSAIEIAGDLEQGGALATRIGPLSVAQIADEVNLSAAQTKKALDELVSVDLLFVRLDGAYVISKFSEKTDGVAAPAESSTSRTRAWRERSRLVPETSPGTSHERSGDGVEEEIERDTPSLRSCGRRRSSADGSHWVEPLKTDVRSMLNASLAELSPDQRFSLARYHAWRWANCAKSDRSNRAKATSIAAGIANLANDKRFGSLRVKDYITHAEAVWQERKKTPWFKPWDITARVEFEAAS